MFRELFNNLLIDYNEFKFAGFQHVTSDATFFLGVAVKYVASFLENDPRLCTAFEEGCAIYPRDTSCKTSKEVATRYMISSVNDVSLVILIFNRL